MIKKSVGGKEINVQANTEIITKENCENNDLTFRSLVGFYIRNEDLKDIYVKINHGSEQLLKPGEMLSLATLTEVRSCIVITEGRIRWGGLI